MTFDTYLLAGAQRSAERRRMPLGLSLLLHGGLLVLGVLYSAMQVEELAAPSLPVIFAPPPAGPPPGPPPARAAARKVVPRVRPRPTALVQPTPNAVAPPEAPAESAEAEPEGQPGGVAGGIPGGQGEGPGGPSEPGTFVSPTVARGQLAIDPQADRYRVKLPPVLARSGTSLWALVRLCVSREGSVTSVKILIGADPLLDPTIVSVLSTWRYRPYTVDGRSVPFCSNLRYGISTP